MPTKTAGDIMTRDVVTIPTDATLREAAMLLTTHDISGAPVVNENGDMVGIVSEPDLLSEARRRAGTPHVAPFGLFVVPEDALKRIYHNGATLLVGEVMTKNVITVPASASLEELGQLMTKRRVNRVPVVDMVNGEERLVGIITREDLLRALFHLDEPGGETRDAGA